MRTIEIFKFEELENAAQYAVIENNFDAIKKECVVYLNEIYSEYIEAFIEIALPNTVCAIDFSINYYNIIVRGEMNTYIDSVTPDAANDVLKKIVNQLKESNNWFADDFQDYFIRQYNGEPLRIFIMKFLNKVTENAFCWFYNMTTNMSYVQDYILGDIAAEYSSPDVFFNDTEFYADGTQYISD